MANYLFTLTITPVQSFISQARQTKDLFTGSEILSNLIQKALENFTEKEIIFPQNKKFVSNKFLVKVKLEDKTEDKTEDEVKELGEELEKGINSAFINLIFKNTQQCDNAFQNFFQVYWVAVKLKEDYTDKDYKESYRNLEQNLGAIKNLRTFSQEAQLKDYPKCVLCGERNQAKEDKKDKLCLICYTKRSYSKNSGSFPSLAKICLLDWLKDVNYDTLKKLPDFDEEWFLEEDKKDEVTQFIKENGLDISKQKKYYALLHFDIDDMGKKLSSLDEKGQRELSNQLGEFAGKAKEIVDTQNNNIENTKCTIYAGGDDFLGFVNLAYLFKVMDKLYCDFESMDMDLTFSTSIIIAHYKAPLHKVLDFSRTLLDETKNYFDDKDGMGIIVLNNSAINAKTICKYENFKLLEKMNEKKIAKNLHFKLAQIFDYLGEMTYDEILVQKQMIKVEIKRLLKREDSEWNEALYMQLIDFLDKQTITLSTNNYKIDFENFIAYLKTLEQLKKVM